MYGMIAAFMWFMSTLFSREYLSHYRNRNRYYLFLLVTLGATEGVFLSADFYTTFIFFEIMSLTSYVWVAHDEKREALRAAGTYLAVAVIGGLVMLMGIFLLYDVTGTLFFDELTGLYNVYGAAANDLQTAAVTQKWGAGTVSASSAMTQLWIAGFCLLFGFGAKAGAFPLHIWLPKAHPVAPAPASALLSGILTKAGMYGILILTAYLFLGNTAWSSMILLLGVCTMVVGAVLALFSVDLKRTLACSSVSQIGFILVGVGMSGLMGAENLIAVRGSLLHMVNHSLIKLTLFMAAGAKLELYHGGIVTVEEFARMPFDRDILTHVIFPGKEQRIAWQSFRNARTDFSVLNCCVSLEEKETRCCVGARPMKAVCLRDEQGILKDGITKESARAFGRYVKENVKTGSNLRGSGEYRSMLAETLAKRALLTAAESLADKR